MNLYTVYHCYQFPDSINTIMAIFWIQSVFIGIFNVLGILSFTNRVKDSYTVDGRPGNRPGCAAAFFTVHYGMFHLAYLFFIAYKLAKAAKVDWLFIQLSFVAILLSSILQFVQDKEHNKTVPVNIGTLFFIPYVRIVPMHLAILLPTFLHIHVGTVFLLLKTVADITMHIIYRRLMAQGNEESKKSSNRNGHPPIKQY